MISTLFSSCALRDMYIDDVLMEKYTGFSLYYQEDFSQIPNIECISWYMENHVTYKKTKERQSPKETMLKGTGDCDCLALLYMNIAYLVFGVKCDLAFCEPSEREIVDGGDVTHAVVRLPGGVYINAQDSSVYTGLIGYIFTFDEVFSK